LDQSQSVLIINLRMRIYSIALRTKNMIIYWITTLFTCKLYITILNDIHFNNTKKTFSKNLLHIDNNQYDNFDQVQQYELFLLHQIWVILVDDKHSNVVQIFDENNQYNVFALLRQQ
jgi:hypothetical protein